MSRAALFFLALCLISAITSCTKGRRADVAPSKTWLRWAMQSEPISSDWTLCRDRACRHLVSLVMEGLTAIEGSGEDRKAVAQLAAGWETPASSKLVFHLRPDVRWSDGEPLVSAHFVNAWKRLLSRCRDIPEARRLFSIVNAAAYCEGKVGFARVGIDAPDARTLVLRLRAPDPQLPLAMSDPSTWPIRGEHGRSATLGRFVLEKWTRGSELRFARNPRYYGEPSEAAGVVVRVIPSAETRVQLYLDGEIDLADDLPPNLGGQLSAHSDLTAEPTPNILALVFNTARKPFHLLATRQAFASALRKDEILTLMRWPHLPTDALLYTPTPAPIAKAVVSKAQELVAHLDLAQYPRPTLAWSGGDDEREIAENLQAQWIKNLELKVDLVGAKARDASVSMTIARISLDPFRPSAHVDAILSRARSKARPVEASFAAANDLLVTKELVVVPLYQETRSSLRRPIAQSLRKQSPDLLEAWEPSE